MIRAHPAPSALLYSMPGQGPTIASCRRVASSDIHRVQQSSVRRPHLYIMQPWVAALQSSHKAPCPVSIVYLSLSRRCPCNTDICSAAMSSHLQFIYFTRMFAVNMLCTLCPATCPQHGNGGICICRRWTPQWDPHMTMMVV